VNYVRAAGNFADRVVAFNAFLSSLRAEELKRRGGTWSGGAWRRPASRVPVRVVSGASDDYLRALSNYSRVATVVLPWLQSGSGAGAWSSLDDASNVPLQTYHEWTADDMLCSWIETPGTTGAKYDAVYRRRCNRNVDDTARASSLQPLFLNAKPINADMYWPNGRHLVPGTLLHRYASARLLRAYSSRCSRH